MYFTTTNIFKKQGRSNYRIPSLIVTAKGTVLAFCNNRLDTLSDHADESLVVCSRKKPGGDWEEVRTLAGNAGWANYIGSAVYDRITDTAFCSFFRVGISRNEYGNYTKEELELRERMIREKEEREGIKEGTYLLKSNDDGETWEERPRVCAPTVMRLPDGSEGEFYGSNHGSAPGIQLRHGKYAGRLLCPSQFALSSYTNHEEQQKVAYNNAVYSDDHGETWVSSQPVQVGTVEGTLIEDGEGVIHYNSRTVFQDGKRRLAVSRDGGATFGEFSIDPILQEENRIGCNASFLRLERNELVDDSLLPADTDGITLFVNPRSTIRENLTIWVSYDSGRTWSFTKTVRKGCSAYSALGYSAVEDRFYLLYELGEETPYDMGLSVAEFDLEWLMN